MPRATKSSMSRIRGISRTHDGACCSLAAPWGGGAGGRWGNPRSRRSIPKKSPVPNFFRHHDLRHIPILFYDRRMSPSTPPPHRHQTPRIVRPRVLAARGRMASLVANPPTNQRPGRGIPPRHLRGDRQGRGAGPERNLPTPRGKTPTAPTREAGEKAPRQAAGTIRSGGGGQTAADPGKAQAAQAPAGPTAGAEAAETPPASPGATAPPCQRHRRIPRRARSGPTPPPLQARPKPKKSPPEANDFARPYCYVIITKCRGAKRVPGRACASGGAAVTQRHAGVA